MSNKSKFQEQYCDLRCYVEINASKRIIYSFDSKFQLIPMCNNDKQAFSVCVIILVVMSRGGGGFPCLQVLNRSNYALLW